MPKERTLVALFGGVGLNSTWVRVYGAALTAACGYLFFEKVRVENNLIFLYLMDAECLQFFIQVMVHEVGQVKRAFPAEFFNRGGIDMAEGQVESLLSGLSGPCLLEGCT